MGSPPKPPRRPSTFATFTATLYIFFGTLFFAGSAVVLGWLPARRKIMLWLARRWARGLMLSAGARLSATFEAPLDSTKRYVLLANHQSYMDIPALLPVVPVKVRFAAKRSLFRIPIFGWSLLVGGFIPIDRDDKSKAGQAFQQAASLLADGESVLFFPEGTRSHDGRLGPFARGGFLVALKSGLPIVPVGLRGLRDVQPRGRFAVSPGPVVAAFGTPIDPAAYGVRRREEL
ncbi:MAG TPA: lysophospholipid acyltransferase family protein, partial [Thermoanaerobaculia bacterium]|nr:lysophospholipid acyltransferase family protein [Thermoanaerobaculia bacterium]